MNSFLNIRVSCAYLCSLLLAAQSTMLVKLGASAIGKCISYSQSVETSTKVLKVENFQSSVGPLQMLWLTSKHRQPNRLTTAQDHIEYGQERITLLFPTQTEKLKNPRSYGEGCYWSFFACESPPGISFHKSFTFVDFSLTMHQMWTKHIKSSKIRW